MNKIHLFSDFVCFASGDGVYTNPFLCFVVFINGLIDHEIAVLLIIIESMTVSSKRTVNIIWNIYFCNTNNIFLESFEKDLSNDIKIAYRRWIFKKLCLFETWVSFFQDTLYSNMLVLFVQINRKENHFKVTIPIGYRNWRKKTEIIKIFYI